ncbi:hypothetical protein ACP4OV_008635 [Aristida adscensionis]
MASTSQPPTIGQGGDRNGEEEAPSEAGGGGQQLVMPEDGYEWKKYGQKFIKNIQKIRSYFRCRHKQCGAKKKVEWHAGDPGRNLRVVYEGAHQHGAPPPAAGDQAGGAAAAAANRYELRAQYFCGAGSQSQ